MKISFAGAFSPPGEHPYYAYTAELFLYPGNRHPLQGGTYWSPEQLEFDVDLSEVKGQQHVKRALEVAAAGGHNMLMIGLQSHY